MSDDLIIIKDCRVSFPHLFEPPVINGEEGSCGAVLLLEPERHKQYIDWIQKGIDERIKSQLKGQKLPAERRCLRDGEDKRPEYAGYMSLSANAKKGQRPIVLGPDGKTQITSAAGCRIYSGCYVHARVRLWTQNNQYGKRINCTLVAIMFSRDGEPMDGTYIPHDKAVDGFEALVDDDDFLNVGEAA